MFVSAALAANLMIGLIFIVGALLGFWIGKSRGKNKITSVSSAPVHNHQAEMDRLKKALMEVESKGRAFEAKELELTLANKRLQSLEEAKSKFIAVTTHQLRTPLSAIKWTFNMVLAGQLGVINEEQKEVLQKGYQSTERMIKIVNDLLNIDQIETERKDYTFTPIQLEELAESILFEFSNQAESKKIELSLKKPAKPLPLVEADALKLRMVLENLIDNAIKYNRLHGQVDVILKDEKINTSHPIVEIVVSDTGIGIPVDDQKRMFNKFFRAGNAILNEPDGTGLGLYLSKDIIEKHGGTIHFETNPKGTHFHIDLPLHQAA
ncbi:MAG: HAMP domain-containing histidine kinase [Candidatus Pacebacteria bacterium]|nr:HAMP domain-containing histidine kinase [Candidatus Paceibacterota bacterium]